MKQINLDAIHEKWLRMAERFAWDFLGTPSQKWAIVDSKDEEKIEILGTFKMPKKSDIIILDFARCTQAIPYMMDLPSETFCLQSLLLSSYPKCLISDTFRGNVGCVWLGGFWQNDIFINDIVEAFPEIVKEGAVPEPCQESQFDERTINGINAHAAFMGLGVVLMEASRKIIDPTVSNKKLIKMSTNLLVCHMGAKNA